VIGPWPAVVVLRVVWILLHDGIDGVITRVGKDGGVEKECEYKPSSVLLCLGLDGLETCACVAWAGIRLLLKGWEWLGRKATPAASSILAARGPAMM
jgi:hypothetical protein